MTMVEKKEDTLPSGSVVPAATLNNETFDPEAQAPLEETHEGEFGTKRDLSPRQVSMIAIAGTIGTGLFLGSGKSLVHGGPVGFWLGYAIMGSLVGMMMYCLGEMTVYSPNVGGFIAMGNKYISPEMGFAMGINYILQVGLAVPGEISAIAIMIGYWDPNTSRIPAYIAIFLVVSVAINVVGVKYFGEVEFWFAMIKIVTLVGLILFGLIADLGGINHVYTGGKYWREEPFNDSFMDLTPVSLSRFLGFWAVLTQAAFSFGGIEGLAVIAGEAYNPRKTMKMATKTVFYRIVGIYFLSTLIIGLNISQHSPDLLDAVAAGGATAASSPFVVICKQVGVKVLPSIINAVVMTSALSSCNENLYACSRTLMALARQRAMPKCFLYTTKAGVPIWGVLVGCCFGLLAFLSISNGSDQAFNWLTNLSALSSLISWITICACSIRFYAALKAQGIDRKNLYLRTWSQPYLAYICIFFFTIVLIFNGFSAFIHGFSISGFFSSYVTLPVFGISYFGYKAIRKTKWVPLEDVWLGDGPEKALRGTKYDRSMQSEAVEQYDEKL